MYFTWWWSSARLRHPSSILCTPTLFWCHSHTVLRSAIHWALVNTERNRDSHQCVHFCTRPYHQMAEYTSLCTTTCAAPCTARIKGKKALINGNRTPVLRSRATELFLPEGDRVGQSIRPSKRALPPAVRHIRPRLRGRLRGRVAAYEG